METAVKNNNHEVGATILMFTTNIYQKKKKLQKNNLQLNLILIVTLIRVKNS